MNKDSRSGSITSDLSVKAVVGTPVDDDQLIIALVKRIVSKVFTLNSNIMLTTSYPLGIIHSQTDQNKMLC
jgi:hypothetical protein